MTNLMSFDGIIWSNWGCISIVQVASFEHIRRPSSLVCIDLAGVKAVAAYLCSQSQPGPAQPSPLIGRNAWPQGCFAGFFIKTLGMGTAMFPQMSVG